MLLFLPIIEDGEEEEDEEENSTTVGIERKFTQYLPFHL